MDEETKGHFATIIESLRKVKSTQLFHGYLLSELVKDIAVTFPDARAYRSDLFERISARADKAPLAYEKNPMIAGFRDELLRFFATLEKGDQQGE